MEDSKTFTVKLGCEIAASIEDVFDAFTSPNELAVWFTTAADVDLRVGGKYSNSDHDKGEYLVVERPTRLRFTWENETHCPGTVVELSLRRSGDQARLDLEHTEINDKLACEDMKVGWRWALDSLKSFLESGKPIPFEVWQKSNPS